MKKTFIQKRSSQAGAAFSDAGRLLGDRVADALVLPALAVARSRELFESATNLLLASGGQARRLIQRNPFAAVAVGLALGLALGRLRKRRSKAAILASEANRSLQNARRADRAFREPACETEIPA